jgi:peptide/nickel transport system ATP-binding protein
MQKIFAHLKKDWLNRWPNELSGGELLRFALARALSPKTRFLIADEITTMVDAITQAQIWNIVLNIVDELNIGVLVVSHDRNLINRLCHDTVYLKDINNV